MLDFNPRDMKARAILKSLGFTVLRAKSRSLLLTLSQNLPLSWGENMEKGLPFSYLFLSALTFKSVQTSYVHFESNIAL
jgi:hypothetical protein